MTSYSTLEIALIAVEGLLSTVGEHVLLEVIRKCAGITALVTGEGPLSIAPGLSCSMSEKAIIK